jgi:hypothetical protein
MPSGEGGPPVEIPLGVHLILWPLLVVWACVVVRQCRRRAWVIPPLIAVALAVLAFVADAAALAWSIAWPTPAATSFVLFLLWLAVFFSATAYVVLRPRGDDGGGGGWEEAGPEPPWWPDFERKFRDYARPRPRPPQPRVPSSSR